MNANGPAGELRVGYQLAARLGRWSMEAHHALPAVRFAIRAPIMWRDVFWSTQRPMRVELFFGSFRWTWDNVTPTIADGSMSVVVEGKPRLIKDATWRTAVSGP